MASDYSFAVLGPVRAWRSGVEVDLGTPQRQAVMAVLLLRAGAYVSAEELVDALWPDNPPKTAIATVRTYVHWLRRGLGGEKLIRSVNSGYMVDPQGDDLDASRFRRLTEEAGRARAEGDVRSAARCLSEGLGLWNGVPLAGIAGRFAETQRALLEEMRLTAAEDNAEDNLALGNHAQLIPDLAAMADEYPYRERVRTLLMLALYRAGRQAEALTVFEDSRRLFSSELGIDPGPDLRDLHLRILNADPSLMKPPPAAVADEQPDARDTGPAPSGQVSQAAPAQLPRDLPNFAGRKADLEFVLTGFTGEDEASSVTVIAGMAAVGKTTLAVHAAHLMADRFPDGQLYVDLHGFDRSGVALSQQDAIRQLLAGLGVPPERIPAEAEAQVGLYRSLLSGHRVLVVLDNALRAEQVRPLLPGDSRCGVLVTSRDQMRSIVGIEGARLVVLSPLSREDAHEALSRRLGAARVDAEPGAADRLIELCAGLPLLLSIVAARAAIHPTHPLASIAAELGDSRNGPNAMADHPCIVETRASLSLSYRELSPNAARLFRLSSLHPGLVVSREAMASLAAISVPAATAGLDELERVHLMTQPEPSCYVSHELVRAYAAEIAGSVPPGEMDAARRRMLDYYRQTAYKAMRPLRENRSPVTMKEPLPGVTVTMFAGPEDSFAWFARVYPVLRALLDQTVELPLPEYTWQLAWALDPFHNREARWQDKIAVHRQALSAAEDLADPALRAHSYRNLSQALNQIGDQQQALEYLSLAQETYVKLGDQADQARNLSHMVAIMLRTGSSAQAKKYAEMALELSLAAGDRELVAAALNNVACGYSLDGDQAAAVEYAQRGLALLADGGQSDFRAPVLCTLGQCQYRAGDYDAAMANLQEALGIFRARHDRLQEANTLNLIAVAQRSAGNQAAARHAWQTALPLLSDLGHDLPSFDGFTRRDDTEFLN